MRVLHVTPYYEPSHAHGGPTRSVPLLCRALVDAGVQTTVLTTNSNGPAKIDVPLGVPINRDGVATWYFDVRAPRSWFYAQGLRAALKAQVRCHDIVHVTGIWTFPSLMAAIESRRANRPYVVSPRGMLMTWEFSYKRWKKEPYYRLFEQRTLGRSAGLHCTTFEEQDALAPLRLRTHSFVIPNPVAVLGCDEGSQRGEMRKHLGIPPRDRIMLFLGRLHPKKGIELTLEVFAELRRSHADLHLVVAGPDEAGYRQLISSWCQARGLQAWVHLTGELGEVGRLAAYSDADLFVLLSESENFGMSAAEAMGCRLPVLLSRHVALSTWADATGGALVVDRDLARATEAARRLLDDAAMAARVAENGYRLVMEKFSREAVAGAMASKYAEILREQGGAGL